MEITENLANILRNYKIKNNLTMAEMADELEIAGSTLQDYLTGKGNPSIKTIEHIASKMGIDPKGLVSNTLSNKSLGTILPTFEMFSLVEQLPQERQQQFVQLFSQLLSLWNDE